MYTEVPVRVDTTPMPHAELVYCNNLEYDVNEIDEIPEHCKKFLFSIGAAIQNQALGMWVSSSQSFLLKYKSIHNDRVL